MQPELIEMKREFEATINGTDEETRNKIELRLRNYLEQRNKACLGYPCNRGFDFTGLSAYLKIPINNIGDPFEQGNYSINVKIVEQVVLKYYAKLWGARLPQEGMDRNKINAYNQDVYWGYLASMGSTESNLYAMWNARDYLQGKELIFEPESEDYVDDKKVAHLTAVYNQPGKLEAEKRWKSTNPDARNIYKPIAFFSKDTHYSIAKACRVLGISTFYEYATRYPQYAEIREKIIKNLIKSIVEENLPGYSNLSKDKKKVVKEEVKKKLPEWMTKWPRTVPSDKDGAINIDALAFFVEIFAECNHPIFVCFNYGTTFRGAYDDVGQAIERLYPILKKKNLLNRRIPVPDKIKKKTKYMDRQGFWFHVDGALGAAYMPFIKEVIDKKDNPEKLGLTKEDLIESNIIKEGNTASEQFKEFDFSFKFGKEGIGIQSISMSGHKWIGAPWPCSVFMTKNKYRLTPPSEVIYIGSRDSTFAGSRNGFSALLFWYYLSKHDKKVQIRRAVDGLKLASYAEKLLKELDTDDNLLAVARSPLSLSIRFKEAAVNEKIIYDYTLSKEVMDDGVYYHFFTMPPRHDYIIEGKVLNYERALLEYKAIIDQLVTDIKTHLDKQEQRRSRLSMFKEVSIGELNKARMDKFSTEMVVYNNQMSQYEAQERAKKEAHNTGDTMLKRQTIPRPNRPEKPQEIKDVVIDWGGLGFSSSAM